MRGGRAGNRAYMDTDTDTVNSANPFRSAAFAKMRAHGMCLMCGTGPAVQDHLCARCRGAVAAALAATSSEARETPRSG